MKKVYKIQQAVLFVGIFGLLPSTSQMLRAQDETIQKMTFDTSLLEPDGTFTEQSLPKFLAKAYDEKKLINEDFSKEACLKAKKLQAEGSTNTLQLFLVTATCRPTQASMYIIKEAKDGHYEATRLKEIEKYPGVKELLAPGMPPKGLPSVALPVASFSYAGPNGKSLHYISAMPTAKGKVLCQLVSEYRDNQSLQNAERIKRAYKILGNEMANFHKRFMQPVPGAAIGKTMIHGDFHCFNVFYDEIGGHFTLIDNETMGTSLKNKLTPADDILKPFFGLFSIVEPSERRDIIKGIDLKKWHDLAFKSFIEGYLDTYALTEQKQALQDLKIMFNSDEIYENYSGNTDFPSIGWLNIPSPERNELRTKYINPVFEEIQKERFK